MRTENDTKRRFSRCGHCLACCTLITALLNGAGAAQPPAPPIGPPAATPEIRTVLSGQVELARLVDLCAERLGMNIEYDAQVLRGTVTLRLGGGLTDEELWTLTNRVLASRGFTSVRMPGEEMVSIVRLADAPGMARLERQHEQAFTSGGGYVTVITRIEHQPMRDILSAVKLVLSKTGSAATQVAESNLLMISDLKPRVDEALGLIQMLDVPSALPSITAVPLEHLPATQVASLVTAAAASRDAITGRPMRGKVTPLPEGNALVLVAPPGEVPFWNELIARFDQREEVVRRTYSPRHFGLQEVGKLIEQSARALGPRGSGDRWRLVTDDLTGTIIVTATRSEHAQIEELIGRLDQVPAEARRPVRAFPVRNRSVRELTEVLARMADAGALEGTEVTLDATSAPANPPPTNGAVPQPQPESRRQGSGPARVVLTPDESTNTLIATGDSRHLAQLEQLIRRLDVRQPQVMIEVLVVSLSESDALDLGVELRKLEITGDTLISLTSLFGLTPGSNLTTLPTPGTGFTGVVLSPGDFSVVLRALQTISRGRSLSMPKALVNNNQTATLDSVLQQPFATLVSIDQVTTTALGGTLDAGTIVTIKPQIAEGDHLVLEYSIALSNFVGESPDPLLPPPRQQNKLQSVVTIPDGFTVVVGGLELTSESLGISQVPLLGDIPLLGEAFKNRSKSQNRSRFYVFIRSNVMRHKGFEDLKYLSDRDAATSSAAAPPHVMRDFPVVEPRIIR